LCSSAPRPIYLPLFCSRRGLARFIIHIRYMYNQ
jgi:hypothetical protein